VLLARPAASSQPVAAISVTQSDEEALGRFLLEHEPASCPAAETANTTG
jgi:hypothetical protein